MRRGNKDIDTLAAVDCALAHVVPMTFHHDTHEFSLTCNGIAEGSAPALGHLDRVLREAFDVKVLPRIGLLGFGGQVDEGIHLGTHHCPERREVLTWCGDPQHVNEFIAFMGLTSESRGWITSDSKATGKNLRTAMDELPSDELFRKVARTALCIVIDQSSVQFAMHEIMSGPTPTMMPWAKLHRQAWYVLHYPEERWNYEQQRTREMLEVLTNTDWAADTETRKSVSCAIEHHGVHLLDGSAAKQPVVALTSGESEFYGIVRTTAFGIQTRELLGQFGVPLRLDILCDSSAARLIRTRSDSGKDRHLSIKELWVHDALRKSEFSLRVVDTLLNWADVGTKSIKKDRLDSVLLQMPLSRGRGTNDGSDDCDTLVPVCFTFQREQRDVLRRRGTSSNGSSRTRLTSLRTRQDRRRG